MAKKKQIKPEYDPFINNLKKDFDEQVEYIVHIKVTSYDEYTFRCCECTYDSYGDSDHSIDFTDTEIFYFPVHIYTNIIIIIFI